MGSGIKFISQVLNQKGAPALYEDIIDNRPAATFEGRLFFATDVVSGDTIFRDNGDGTWSALAGNGGGGGTFINGVTDLTGGVGLGGSLDQDTEILLDARSFKFTYNGDCLLLDPVNDLYYFGKGNALDAGCGIHITENIIYTQYSTNQKGFYLAFAANFYSLGDYGESNNATHIDVVDSQQKIRTVNQFQEIGLNLDFQNQVYQLGDFNSVGNGTTFVIDNQNTKILTKYNSNEIGLKLDFSATNYSLGDFEYISNGTYLNINDNNSLISTNFSGNQVGIILNNNNKTYILGDPSGSNNGSSFGVDDDQQTLTCTQVTSLDPGLLIAGWIKIKVDGNYYVMPYYSI